MENSNNNGKLVGALLVGAAVGAVLGILFAPAKGSETRKVIAGKSEELSSEVKDKFSELLEAALKEYEKAKEKAASVFSENGSSKKDKEKTA